MITLFENFFRPMKKKEMPKEVENFCDVLCHFVRNHLDYEGEIFATIDNYKPKDSNYYNVFYINTHRFINGVLGGSNFISVRFNPTEDSEEDTEKLNICVFRRPEPELIEIENFLKYIISDLAVSTDFNKWTKEFIITLDKILDIEKKLNDEEFDIFMNANKYNL